MIHSERQVWGDEIRSASTRRRPTADVGGVEITAAKQQFIRAELAPSLGRALQGVRRTLDD